MDFFSMLLERVINPPDNATPNELETLIDQSGVLDSTEGTATEKVEQLIGKASELDVFMNITNASGLFCSAKNLPSTTVVNLPNLTNGDLKSMFSGVTSVKKIILNIPRCYSIEYAFDACAILEEIVLNFSTKGITRFNQACQNARVLKKIVGALDFSSATNVGWMFNNCYALEEVTFEPNTLSVSFMFTWSPKLTTESIQSIIDGLATVETAQTLTLNSTVLSQVTDEQWQIAEEKNWIIS